MRLILTALSTIVVVTLSGCSGGDEDDDRTDVAGAIGGADSTCPLPVTFDRARGWAPERIADDAGKGEPALEALVRPGPFRVACELESPVNVGYLRIYVGPTTLASEDPEQVLGQFVKDLDEGIEPIFASFESGEGLVGTEVAYVDILAGERVKRRAFLVAGTDGVAVVHVGGLDDEEHAGMLPTFELAKESVRVSG